MGAGDGDGGSSAKAELEAWPTTEDLGMTDRTREILESITQRRSVLDAFSEAP